MEETPMKPITDRKQIKKYIPTGLNTNYVTVSCRLKPLLEGEERSIIEVNHNHHTITISQQTKSISKKFQFDLIFQENTNQKQFVDRMCDPLISFLKKGGDTGLLFSYGITNSGKTYSILGTPEKPGILLGLIQKISNQFKDQPIQLISLQLYKDQFYSLKNKGQKLVPRQIRGTFNFEDYQYDIVNEQNMESLFRSYLQNRAVSSTSQNSHSSRSHAIFKIKTSKFKIGIIDLAGSQRYQRSQNCDIKETVFINSSLLSLKKCIIALQQRSKNSQGIVIPYRESKLTQSLVQYFSPTSKINIIVNMNQSKKCLEQNIKVMDYTSKAKNITPNSQSEFTMMIKNSYKKYEQLKSALKSIKKNPNLSQPVLKLGQKEYLITEQMLSDQETEAIITKEIIESQRKSMRKSMIQKKMENQFYQQFCEDSRKFMHYLEVDSKMRKQQIEQKLQDFRNINIELSKSKQKLDKQGKIQQMEYQRLEKIQYLQIKSNQIGVNTNELQIKTQLIKQAQLKFQLLNTTLKRKLIQMYQQQRRNRFIDAQTLYSPIKQHQLKNQKLQIQNSTDNTGSGLFNVSELQEKTQIQFQTPFKNKQQTKNNIVYQIQEESEKLSEEELNFIQKSYQKSVKFLGSGLKMVQQGFNTLSNLTRRKNYQIVEENQNQQTKDFNEKRKKLNFTFTNIQQHISPFKIPKQDTQMITDFIQILPSSLKKQFSQNDQFDTNSQKFDVGIQVFDLQQKEIQNDPKINSIKEKFQGNKKVKGRKGKKIQILDKKEVQALNKEQNKLLSAQKINLSHNKYKNFTFSTQKSMRKFNIAKNTRAARRIIKECQNS